jgi:hypothetical protein
MSERAAHLMDEVIPFVPVRQWMLTLPYRLRYLLAWDHGLSRAVLAVHARALLDFYRQQAQRQGIRAGRTRAVTAVQRFGGGLNLNVALSHAGPRRGVRPVPGRRLAFHAASDVVHDGCFLDQVLDVLKSPRASRLRATTSSR